VETGDLESIVVNVVKFSYFNDSDPVDSESIVVNVVKFSCFNDSDPVDSAC
jgi:hypothetical protein